jgi:hypothetical protein
VKDAEFELENYTGGVPSHPEPEATGRLVLTDTQWQIHYGGKGVIKGKKWFYGGMAALPLKPTAMGPNSCRVAILAKNYPLGIATFDLPHTKLDDIVLAEGARLQALQGSSGPSAPATATSSQWWSGIKVHCAQGH